MRSSAQGRGTRSTLSSSGKSRLMADGWTDDSQPSIFCALLRWFNCFETLETTPEGWMPDGREPSWTSSCPPVGQQPWWCDGADGDTSFTRNCRDDWRSPDCGGCFGPGRPGQAPGPQKRSSAVHVATGRKAHDSIHGGFGLVLGGVGESEVGRESTTNEVHVRSQSLHRPTMLGRHGPHIVPPCWPLESEPLHFCLSSHASSCFVYRPPPGTSSPAPGSGTHSSQLMGFLPCAQKVALLVCLGGNMPRAPVSAEGLYGWDSKDILNPQVQVAFQVAYLHPQWGQGIVLAALSSDLDPPTWFDCRRPSQARMPTSPNSRRGNGLFTAQVGCILGH